MLKPRVLTSSAALVWRKVLLAALRPYETCVTICNAALWSYLTFVGVKFWRKKTKVLMWILQVTSKLEARYVMETLPDRGAGDTEEEWWSAESELAVWPSHKQLERKLLQVVCRAVVLNETVYQRTATLNVTSASSLAQRSSRPSSTSSGQVSASIASSQHSRDSHSFAATNKGTADES